MNVNDMGVAELRLAVQELRRYPADVLRLEEHIAALENELGAALAIIDKLPKTADDVTIVPNMRIWLSCEVAGWHGQPFGKAVEAVVVWVGTDAMPMRIQFRDGVEWEILPCRVHNTREAAEAEKDSV